ncbi:ASCH domain-containing protein [Iodobacter fluviatilis]|uniref:RNA-binding protein n=1 Tax=Iodobacter fluviatilis TaxID=537 RepID=A0A7G3GAN7_9NEIS|nr:ASCH domain-containing protein [Iodobacter fluviatilis]QBC43805.1 RNA-binding protein [Iodobacter fluviatilis]
MEVFPPLAQVLSKLNVLGISLPDGPVLLDGYGDSPELSEELLALIRQGKKRAGTGLLWGHEADQVPVPCVGDLQIVLDHHNEPALITRVVSTYILPYAEVTAEYAAIEGEGDGSLEYWRQAHWAFFARACEQLGRQPAESMPVVCCVFEVLHILPLPVAA